MAQYRSRTTASCALPARAENGAIAMTGLGFQGGRLGAAIGRAAKDFARRFTLSKSGGVAHQEADVLTHNLAVEITGKGRPVDLWLHTI